MSAPVTQRVAVLDVLRGFALFGILLANIWFFAQLDAVPRTESWHAVHLAILLVVDAKFYTLFAFLFGYGFGLQLTRLESVAPLRRRYTALLVIGLLHGCLLYDGDVLVSYAITGFLLLTVRRASDARALRLALFGYLLGTGLLLLITGLADPDDRADVMTSVQAMNASVGSAIGERTVSYLTEVVAGLVTGYPFIFLSLFLAGMVAARRKVLETELPAALLRRVALAGLGIGLPLVLALSWFWSDGELDGSVPAQATAPLITAGYVALLLLAWRTGAGRRALSYLAPMGRLSLTNYLTQSLICAFLFTAYGFRLGGNVQPTEAMGIACGIFGAQLVLSNLYLRWFRIGPVEWVLRSITYWRVQPFRRAGVTTG
ncbi:DUF418 domain-containing protein [Pseudonocardiaceae bacterium YIM PH 21723]|nr:DUF418 domain-containing protein [Pseudonocardiaceae bacterium YIM PH 21723]